MPALQSSRPSQARIAKAALGASIAAGSARDVERLLSGRDHCAQLIAQGDEWALPLFERLEREIEALSARESALDRARRIAAESAGRSAV